MEEVVKELARAIGAAAREISFGLLMIAVAIMLHGCFS
jgi:hypothetical protein